MDGRLTDNATLITDKHPSYKAFSKDNPKIKYKALLAKEHVDKKDKIRNSKTTIKQWCITMLLSDQAYHLYELFKQNAVIIRT